MVHIGAKAFDKKDLIRVAMSNPGLKNVIALRSLAVL